MTVNIPEDNDYIILSEECPILVVGDTYTVVLNGVEYHCIARVPEQFEDCVVLGNETILGHSNEGNGEPFAIDSDIHGDIYLNVSTAGDYTIRIFHREQQLLIHQLDKKYLPTDINKMDKINPSGTGSFTFNTYTSDFYRGVNSFAAGDGCISNARDAHVIGTYNISPTTVSIGEWQYRTYNERTSNIYFSDKIWFNPAVQKIELLSPSYGTLNDILRQSGIYYYYSDKSDNAIIFKTIDGTYTTDNSGKVSPNTMQVFSQYSSKDEHGNYIFVVGNGETGDNRSNAHTVDWNGNAWFAGDVYVGSVSGADRDYGSKKLATEEYVIQKVTEINVETPIEYDAIILKSSTSGSTKKFRLTIGDDGVLSAEEVIL